MSKDNVVDGPWQKAPPPTEREPETDRPVALNVLIHEDLRGFLFETWRADMSLIPPVQQVNIVGVRPGVIKGWYRHQKQWEIITCVQGEIQIIAWKDVRDGDVQDAKEGIVEILNQRNTRAFVVPAGWWHGVQNIGVVDAVLVEMVTEIFDPVNPDKERMDPFALNGELWQQRRSG